MLIAKGKILLICSFLLVTSNIVPASLPSSPFGQEQFEGFPDQFNLTPVLGAVDPDAPYMSVGDACPCVGCGGTLIIDPFDGDGLTCDNPACPCGYYVTVAWLDGKFLGFPLPLNNNIFVLFILSLLYLLRLKYKSTLLKLKE